jgi:putative transposase
MSNYRRIQINGASYFFTVVTHNRRKFLTDDLARPILKDVFRQVQSEMLFRTIALCLMPDHIHCIWRLPQDSSDYSKRWSMIKRLFTKRYLAAGGREIAQSMSRENKGERGIWQRRFWEHCIRDNDDMTNHIHYIHYNPVKHRQVESPDQWPYSTFQRFSQKGTYAQFDWNLFAKKAFGDNIEYQE